MPPDVLADLVEHLPRDAALWVALDPESASWTLTDVLLGALINLTAREKVVRFPWEASDDQTVTGDVMTLDEAHDWLGW